MTGRDDEAVSGSPRIPPGTPRDIGLVSSVIARVIGLATGTNPPNLFTTLARHRRLYRPWLRFASRLMPGGRLPRADSELVILRVSALTGCTYERAHHEQLARSAGLSGEEIEQTTSDLEHGRWRPRQEALLTAVDELVATQDLTDETWELLRQHLDEIELIELPMLVGHYVMLAMALNGLRVETDRAEARGRLGRLVAGVAARRTRSRKERT